MCFCVVSPSVYVNGVRFLVVKRDKVILGYVTFAFVLSSTFVIKSEFYGYPFSNMVMHSLK